MAKAKGMSWAYFVSLLYFCLSLVFVMFAVYSLPNVIFNYHYPIPDFFYHYRDFLVGLGTTNVWALEILMLLPFLLLGGLCGFLSWRFNLRAKTQELAEADTNQEVTVRPILELLFFTIGILTIVLIVFDILIWKLY